MRQNPEETAKIEYFRKLTSDSNQNIQDAYLHDISSYKRVSAIWKQIFFLYL